MIEFIGLYQVCLFNHVVTPNTRASTWTGPPFPSHPSWFLRTRHRLVSVPLSKMSARLLRTTTTNLEKQTNRPDALKTTQVFS